MQSVKVPEMSSFNKYTEKGVKHVYCSFYMNFVILAEIWTKLF